MRKVKQNVDIKHNQEANVLPQMIQSLKMLSLPLLDLETYLIQEIIENPMLELADEVSEDNKDQEKKESEKLQELDEVNIANEQDSEVKKTIEEAKELSEVLDDWNDYHKETGGASDSASDDDEPQYENFVQAEENHKLDFINEFDKYTLAENEYYYIYDLIDSSSTYGFLPKDFDIYALADEYELKHSRADYLHRLILRTYPRGITARSIEECLFHQLERYEQEDPLLSGIVVNDFDDLINRRYHKIAFKYDVSEEDVLTCRDRIGRLDPKPGLRITSGKPQYIVPDIIVVKIEDEFEIIINDFNIPKITLSRKYSSILSEMGHDKDAVNYVRTKINSAKFVIKSMFMRNRTLERVMRAIIKNQRNFFYNNTGVLDPLTYAVIALEVGVNESTISRVVKRKYADTHYGVYCLKDFFVANAGKEKGFESVSRQNVQHQIKKMIEEEDTSAPISDQDIVDRLKERDISVSRRVIAKYRDEMQIPNSRERKR